MRRPGLGHYASPTGIPKSNINERNILMLGRAKTLHGYKLSGFDGEIGKVKEFYFDDRHWAIRYLVADTGNWLASKRVLISPYALVKIITEAKDITVDLTKKQIENSPPSKMIGLSLVNSRRTITGTMATQNIGSVHACGEGMSILNATIRNG